MQETHARRRFKTVVKTKGGALAKRTLGRGAGRRCGTVRKKEREA